MFKLPKIIAKIVTKQAGQVYWQSYGFNCRWADFEDFRQEAYLKIHQNGMWECQDATLIYLAVKSACLDYMRKNIPGHRQRKPINYIDDITDCLRTTNDPGGLGDPTDCKIGLHQMLACLSKVQQGIVRSLIEGVTQREIGEQLGVTEIRVSQIRKEIINKLFEIETGKRLKQKAKRDKKGLFTVEKKLQEIKGIEFKGFCVIHPSRKIFNKKRGICWSCYQKLVYLRLLKTNEEIYLPILKRRLRHGEVDRIRRTYGG